jgi:hypothetical protein
VSNTSKYFSLNKLLKPQTTYLIICKAELGQFLSCLINEEKEGSVN